MKEYFITETDAKGREFSIVGDLQDLQSSLQPYIDVDPDDEEYGINHMASYDPFDERDITPEDREKDEEAFQAILNYQYDDWKKVLERITRKKNGTFAKGRVICLHRGESYAHYWEESYGWNAPEMRVKTLDDFTAKLEFVNITESY